MAKDTTKVASQARVDAAEKLKQPLWARLPRGWIVLALFILAWVAVYLIWNGITLLSHF